MNKNIELGYIMLYKFLKENRILPNYLNNIKPPTVTPQDVKKKLINIVEKYTIDHYHMNSGENYFGDLFNWAPSSFFWDKSIEGERFWRLYYDKWRIYYNKMKGKYIL